MNKSTSFTIITSLTLILGLAGAIALVKNSQDYRSSASFSTGSLVVLPTDNNVTLNNEFTLHFKVQNTPATVNAFQTVFCYNESQVQFLESSIAYPTGFTQDVAKAVSYTGKTCYGIAAHNTAGVSGASIDLVSVKFKALATGSGQIEVLTGDKTMIAGANTASETDKVIAMTSITGANYNINSGVVVSPTPTTTPGITVTPTPDLSVKRIKARMSFLNVLPNASDCMNSIPISVIALNNGVRTGIDGVVAYKKAESNVNGFSIYEAEIPLKGVSLPTNTAALFIKGPKHLQMKFGVNNQSNLYDEAGGKLQINNDKSTVETYDFSKVPILAGDVMGSTESQDGIINAIDYSYIKREANNRTEVSSGGYLKADLDGSCQVNGRDVSTLLNSLQEKQSQLY